MEKNILNDVSMNPNNAPKRPPRPKRESKKMHLSKQYKITNKENAFGGKSNVYLVEIKTLDDIIKHLSNTRNSIFSFLLDQVTKSPKKFYESTSIRFYKHNEGGRMERDAHFNNKSQSILKGDDLHNIAQKSSVNMINHIEKYQKEGSGWVVDRILEHKIHLNDYRPLEGNMYMELPDKINYPHNGLVNIKNDDDKCFMWCHVAYLVQAPKNLNRITKVYKERTKTLDYSGINFPVSTKDYNKIEKKNNISINVFGVKGVQRYPIYISKEKYEDILDLLLINDDKRSHYVWIKDFNTFNFKQNKSKNKKHFCRRCIQCFSSKQILEKHIPDCIVFNGKQAIKMPKKGSVVKFVEHKNELKVPFIIYADFEAITVKVNNSIGNSTVKIQDQKCCGYGYKVVCCYDDQYTKDFKIYRGEDAAYRFIEEMINEYDYCKDIIKTKFNEPIVMTDEDKHDFINAINCSVCNEPFKADEQKYRDHCHITGKYRGAAHNKCNLKYSLSDVVPVVFHNLRNYDSHFIMQEIGKFKRNIKIIPNNMQRYLAFMLGKIRFIDSIQFMSSSLDSLFNNLEKKDIKYLRETFKDNTDLMAKKGIYPYDYMDSFDRFDETKLPKKEEF